MEADAVTIVVAVIAATPPTIAAVLAYRSAKSAALTVQGNGKGNVVDIVERIEHKVTALREDTLSWQANHELAHVRDRITDELEER